MNLEQEVLAIVADALGQPAGSPALHRGTALLGAHPDFTSMAVLAVLTGLEERLGLALDEVLVAEDFGTVGRLIDTVAAHQGR